MTYNNRRKTLRLSAMGMLISTAYLATQLTSSGLMGLVEFPQHVGAKPLTHRWCLEGML